MLEEVYVVREARDNADVCIAKGRMRVRCCVKSSELCFNGANSIVKCDRSRVQPVEKRMDFLALPNLVRGK